MAGYLKRMAMISVVSISLIVVAPTAARDETFTVTDTAREVKRAMTFRERSGFRADQEFVQRSMTDPTFDDADFGVPLSAAGGGGDPVTEPPLGALGWVAAHGRLWVVRLHGESVGPAEIGISSEGATDVGSLTWVGGGGVRSGERASLNGERCAVIDSCRIAVGGGDLVSRLYC